MLIPNAGMTAEIVNVGETSLKGNIEKVKQHMVYMADWMNSLIHHLVLALFKHIHGLKQSAIAKQALEFRGKMNM